MNKYCHPSYTVEECNIFCRENPQLCRSNEVPEPGVFALLAVALLAAALVRRVRRI